MAVKLSRSSYEYAQQLIKEGQFVPDERDDWSEHQPSTREENRFIEEHGMAAYAKWHLGYDDAKPEDTKGRCKFPYGDFDKVHRCAIITVESRAGQYKYKDIEFAAAHLHGMIDALV